MKLSNIQSLPHKDLALIDVSNSNNQSRGQLDNELFCGSSSTFPQLVIPYKNRNKTVSYLLSTGTMEIMFITFRRVIAIMICLHLLELSNTLPVCCQCGIHTCTHTSSGKNLHHILLADQFKGASLEYLIECVWCVKSIYISPH